MRTHVVCIANEWIVFAPRRTKLFFKWKYLNYEMLVLTKRVAL